MLSRRALHPYLLKHVPWVLEREPECDLGRLVKRRASSSKIWSSKHNSGLHPDHQKQRNHLYLQLKADLNLLPIRSEVCSQRIGAPTEHKFIGDEFLNFSLVLFSSIPASLIRTLSFSHVIDSQFVNRSFSQRYYQRLQLVIQMPVFSAGVFCKRPDYRGFTALNFL